MKLEVGKYRINSDKYGNINISEMVTTKNDTIQERRITGYHSSIENCMQDFITKRMFGSETKDLTELVQ